jgi:hypothetical protein
MNQKSGSNEPCPEGPSGGSGWGCTSGCFLPPNTTVNPDPTYRDLEMYVQSLLGFGSCSSAYCAMTDAITGIIIHSRPNPGYQDGAILAIREAFKNHWFDDYDWVIRLNPDVLIRSNSFLLEQINDMHIN